MMYYVVGLGKSGHSFYRAFPDSLVWDDGESAPKGLTLTPPENVDWSRIKALILSPGIAHNHPKPHKAALLAAQHHVPIWCDVEVFLQQYPNLMTIGVTGTNGKSTTTALIHHILKSCHLNPLMGGNIGKPVFNLKPENLHTPCVLEFSSYHLERLPSWESQGDIGVITNITPDHLSRHGGIQGYIQAKQNILGAKKVLIALDTPPTLAMYQEFKDQHPCLIPVSLDSYLDSGLYVQAGILYENRIPVADLSTIKRLPGLHNAQNMALAFGVARLMGCDIPEIMQALESFQGLAHRLEWVAERHGLTFINDSKGTNPEATAHALKAYENIYWILGGQAKETGLAGLDAFYDRIKGAYLMGEASHAFYETLSPHLPAQILGTLDKAFTAAVQDAQVQGGGVILLSPACASWDQYTSFEARGEHFKTLVHFYLESCL